MVEEMIKRTARDYVMQYVLLPVILVGSDIIIGMMGHYSGTVGLFNVFSLDNFIDYLFNYYTELLLFLVIALLIALYVEYHITTIGKRVK